MNNSIKDISKQLEILASIQNQLCLKDGLLGIALYFFCYARFTKKEKYESFANDILEKVLNNILTHNSYDLVSNFIDLARIINFLKEEKFLEIETDEFVGYFEDPLILRMKQDVGVDFSFYSGLIGLCDFFLNRINQEEALEITMKHLCSALQVKGFPKHPIEMQFLFPSEILRDVKIFLLNLEKLNIIISQKDLLKQAMWDFEQKNAILQSNCIEYSILQDLREAEIMKDHQKIQISLKTIIKTSSNIILQGLSLLSLADDSLPAWWKLI
ncbi:MAG: hypothetical protein LBU90_05000 [Bacteroidales bacterium]|jgi:hypothetical protein|nr:hypothetical protein [Bacteroidales bacterium]